MATSLSSEDLERRRVDLEQNVAKLQKSLLHWQTWEAEYEGFREELNAAGSAPSSSQIQEIAATYDGELVTPEECKSLVQGSQGTVRNVDQILSALSRRLDYVVQNVKTLWKQHDAAVSQHDVLNAVLDAQPRDEEGLPLQDIMEELDDDDNVVSSTVKNHKDAAPEALEALRKGGVKGLPSPKDEPTSAKVPTENANHEQALGVNAMDLNPDVSIASATAAPTTKSVRFAASVDEKPLISESSPPPSRPTVHEQVIKSFESDFPKNPSIPGNEPPEQAAVRREMLDYNMGEIGAIVAEMDIESGAEDYSDGSQDDYDEDGPEDSFGRTAVPVIDDAYRQEMLELERKLHARYLVNAGSDPLVASAIVGEEPQEVVKETSPKSEDQAQEPRETQKKGVRFAESLDIQSPPAAANTPKSSKDVSSTPLSESIVERSVADEVSNKPPEAKKPSRFLANRGKLSGIPSATPALTENKTVASGPLAGHVMSSLQPVHHSSRGSQKISDDSDEVPRGPPGKIHSDILVENNPTEAARAPSPDELDSQLLQQQMASDYYRLRNNMIQRNGGYTATESEDEDDEAPQMSKFMAARLGQVKR